MPPLVIFALIPAVPLMALAGGLVIAALLGRPADCWRFMPSLFLVLGSAAVIWIAMERDTMHTADEYDSELPCFRDNTTVSAESPQCLHPSSFCDFRETCPVIAAERANRRRARRDADQ